MKDSFENETDIYRHDVAYAKEHGELKMYNASFELNIACSRAIEEAITKHYSDNRLNSQEALRDVRSRFSMERIEYVLANAIRFKDHDGRIGSGNKKWAQGIPVTTDKDPWGENRNCYFIIDRVNPGLVDLFADRFRKEKEEK